MTLNIGSSYKVSLQNELWNVDATYLTAQMTLNIGSSYKVFLQNELWNVDANDVTAQMTLVRKLRQLTPLSLATPAKPKCFILLCRISCELAGCVHQPIVSSESTIVG
jgi:hypothetical protein